MQQVLMEFNIYATTSVLQDLGNLKCLKDCDSKWAMYFTLQAWASSKCSEL